MGGVGENIDMNNWIKPDSTGHRLAVDPWTALRKPNAVAKYSRLLSHHIYRQHGLSQLSSIPGLKMELKQKALPYN